jgi:hypothetical protein
MMTAVPLGVTTGHWGIPQCGNLCAQLRQRLVDERPPFTKRHKNGTNSNISTTIENDATESPSNTTAVTIDNDTTVSRSETGLDRGRLEHSGTRPETDNESDAFSSATAASSAMPVFPPIPRVYLLHVGRLTVKNNVRERLAVAAALLNLRAELASMGAAGMC